MNRVNSYIWKRKKSLRIFIWILFFFFKNVIKVMCLPIKGGGVIIREMNELKQPPFLYFHRISYSNIFNFSLQNRNLKKKDLILSLLFSLYPSISLFSLSLPIFPSLYSYLSLTPYSLYPIKLNWVSHTYMHTHIIGEHINTYIKLVSLKQTKSYIWVLDDCQFSEFFYALQVKRVILYRKSNSKSEFKIWN